MLALPGFAGMLKFAKEKVDKVGNNIFLSGSQGFCENQRGPSLLLSSMDCYASGVSFSGTFSRFYVDRMVLQESFRQE
jgi:hypothetical protein